MSKELFTNRCIMSRIFFKILQCKDLKGDREEVHKCMRVVEEQVKRK
jgi:hypothetical protein